MNTKKNNVENRCEKCGKNSMSHIVENAKVKVHAPKPVMGRMEYAPCSVTELLGGSQPAFVITPLPPRPWAQNDRIFCVGDMKVHTRKSGRYVLTLVIDPEVDQKRVKMLRETFKSALDCTFAYDKSKKEEEEVAE